MPKCKLHVPQLGAYISSIYIYPLYIYIYILYILYIYIYIRILYRYFLQFCSFPIAKMADKVCLPAVPPRLSPQLADGLSRRTSLGSCQTFPHRPRLRARALYCGLSGHLSSAVSNRSLYLAHSSYRCVCVCGVSVCLPPKTWKINQGCWCRLWPNQIEFRLFANGNEHHKYARMAQCGPKRTREHSESGWASPWLKTGATYPLDYRIVQQVKVIESPCASIACEAAAFTWYQSFMRLNS